MKKQSVQKLALLLKGLEQRLEENSEFFKEINALYKSGTKTFTARLILREKDIIMNFNGRNEKLKIQDLSERLSNIAESYEAVTVNYDERGTFLVIDADDKNVKMRTGERQENSLKQFENETSRISDREYYIRPGEADELLKAIGIMGSNGKIKNDMIRKYNQIDHFVELIDGMLKNLAEKYGSINVIDCGCGKSYLTFVLNYYIREVLKVPCHFIGLDYSDTVINASREIANKLGYKNMEFHVKNIDDYKADSKIHLLISLHACDTATDKAIALGIRNNISAMVVVPCCHREMLSQYNYEPFAGIIKHGILKARIADALTDGMRALLLESLGYKVSIVEYISPLETPKNLMMRIEKQNGPNKSAREEYEKLSSLLGVDLELYRQIYK